MGFSETVHWWQEWQLRILALSSLFFQYFLFMASLFRKRRVSSWVRFFIWLAYLGSDAIALYALAALFNYPRQVSLGVKILWAPILLVHLGGQDCITAYNIEDNELWKRHVVTAMSQVTVAIYVFWKSWSPDKNGNYLQAAILLFFPGILKCILKPWDLKRVSMNSLVSSSGSKGKGRVEIHNNPEDFVKELVRLAQQPTSSDGDQQQQRTSSDGGNEVPLFERPYDLFVDLAPLNSDRLRCLKHFRDGGNNLETAHTQIRSSLSVTFDRLYTKESFLMRPPPPDKDFLRTILDRFSNFIDLLRILAICCILAVIVLVPITQVEAMDTDVMITYILLVCTAALEYLIPLLIFNRFSQLFGQQQWPDQVSQHNLLWYLAQNKKRRWFRKLAILLGCKEYLDQHYWCLPSCNSAADITNLVHDYLKKGLSEITDMATYRAFNDNRGQWTLNQEGCGDSLDWNLRRQFDESVLLWHLATDLCFHLMHPHTSREETVRRCREMSNYMVYLLFVNPEMLMTGARRSFFRAAYEELKKMTGARRSFFRAAYEQLKKTLRLKPQQSEGDAGPSPQVHHVDGETVRAERALAQKIDHNFKHARSTAPVGEGSQNSHEATGHEDLSIVHDAWNLSEKFRVLHSMHGEEKMWKVIQGVWVEMLCFSAGRCRDYLHAKSLGTGGEYLSYVWLLLLYMGMETLGEKMQRTNPLEEETNNAGATPPMAVPMPRQRVQRLHGDGATTSQPPPLRHVRSDPR